MTNVGRRERFSTLRPARELKQFRWWSSILAVVAVCSSTVAFSPRVAGASGISNDRAKAVVLYSQIQRINARVGFMGQRYDQAHGKLINLNHEINNTRATVATIERNVSKGNHQLQLDAIFAYVTNGSAASNNPLFSSNATKVGATNVYNQLAEGNVSATLAGLKNYKIQLIQQRSALRNEAHQAADAANVAAKAFHDAQVLENSLQHALHQVKGQIAYFITQQEAAAAAQSRSAITQAQPVAGFPAPPPNSQADIAIRTALSLVGVPYVWGGASRGGVDCSGLVMLAYAAAGIFLPHYSGAQFADTVRVPLYDLQPGDILFYGYNGDEHEAMYLGNGQMIEAPYTGAYVHITPVRLGYGFAGAGRPRA